MDNLEDEECAIIQAMIPDLRFGHKATSDGPLKIMGLKLSELFFRLEQAGNWVEIRSIWVNGGADSSMALARCHDMHNNSLYKKFENIVVWVERKTRHVNPWELTRSGPTKEYR